MGTEESSLSASYQNSTITQHFTKSLPSSSVTSTKEKTAYLSALRKSVISLQDEVNGFLTRKMDEDKATTAEAGLKADDKAEENNYGEEKVEDD
ncbi:hypothetical protein ACLMJK_005228 [Lecanora helva]